MNYVTHEEFAEVKEDIRDIKENHLPSILSKIGGIAKDVKNLRWFFLGGIGLLGVVLAILQVFG